MTVAMDESEKQIFVRALVDDASEEIGEVVALAKERMERLDETSERNAEILTRTLTEIDQALEKTRNMKAEVDMRLLAVESKPRTFDVVQPLVKNDVDLKPVAEAMTESISKALQYEREPPEFHPHINVPEMNLAPVAEMLGHVVERAMKYDRQPAPVSFHADLKSIEKTMDAMTKAFNRVGDMLEKQNELLAAVVKESSAKKPKGKVKIVHGEKESKIVFEE